MFPNPATHAPLHKPGAWGKRGASGTVASSLWYLNPLTSPFPSLNPALGWAWGDAEAITAMISSFFFRTTGCQTGQTSQQPDQGPGIVTQ